MPPSRSRGRLADPHRRVRVPYALPTRTYPLCPHALAHSNPSSMVCSIAATPIGPISGIPTPKKALGGQAKKVLHRGRGSWKDPPPLGVLGCQP